MNSMQFINCKCLFLIRHLCCLHHALLISSAGCIYGKIPSGTQNVDHSSSSGWLMLFTEKQQQSYSFMWKFALNYYFYLFLLCLLREKLHWMLYVFGSLTSIKRTVARFGGVGCVGCRMKNYSPVVVDAVRELKRQMRSLLSRSLCWEKSFVHPEFIE